MLLRRNHLLRVMLSGGLLAVVLLFAIASPGVRHAHEGGHRPHDHAPGHAHTHRHAHRRTTESAAPSASHVHISLFGWTITLGDSEPPPRRASWRHTIEPPDKPVSKGPTQCGCRTSPRRRPVELVDASGGTSLLLRLLTLDWGPLPLRVPRPQAPVGVGELTLRDERPIRIASPPTSPPPERSLAS